MDAGKQKSRLPAAPLGGGVAAPPCHQPHGVPGLFGNDSHTLACGTLWVNVVRAVAQSGGITIW